MENTLRQLYLDLIKSCLIGLIYEDKPIHWHASGSIDFDSFARTTGHDWPSQAHSMIGLERMNNIQHCVEVVIKENIPGDFIETGVWRGGACIFLRAILQAYSIKDRCIWVADSFEGVPPPNADLYPQDAGIDFYQSKELAISLQQVQKNFKSYGLLDEQVKFLKGWFRDTLPTAPIKELALLRLDGDLYESTMDSLTHLYQKVSIGGYIIIDDYGDIEACRKAVQDFREANNIKEELYQIDWTGVYWRRLS